MRANLQLSKVLGEYKVYQEPNDQYQFKYRVVKIFKDVTGFGFEDYCNPISLLSPKKKKKKKKKEKRKKGSPCKLGSLSYTHSTKCTSMTSEYPVFNKPGAFYRGRKR